MSMNDGLFSHSPMCAQNKHSEFRFLHSDRTLSYSGFTISSSMYLSIFSTDFSRATLCSPDNSWGSPYAAPCPSLYLSTKYRRMDLLSRGPTLTDRFLAAAHSSNSSTAASYMILVPSLITRLIMKSAGLPCDTARMRFLRAARLRSLGCCAREAAGAGLDAFATDTLPDTVMSAADCM